jgi:hypothetical protein
MSKIVKKVIGGVKSTAGLDRFGATKHNVNKSPFTQAIVGAGDQEAARKSQANQTTRLEETATGKRPSLAEAQLKAATNRSLSQQVGASQARRGGSAASRERSLSRQSGQARREVAETSAVQRIQEQQAAEQQLTQQLAAQRAQDIGIAQGDRASQQKLEEILVQQNLGVQQLNLSGQQSAAAARGKFIKNVGSGIAAMTGSDKNIKTKIKKEEENKIDIKLPSKPAGPPKEEEKKGPDAATIMKLAPMLAALSDEKNKKNKKKESDSDFEKRFKAGLSQKRKEKMTPVRKLQKSGSKAEIAAHNKAQASKGNALAKKRNSSPSKSSKFAEAFSSEDEWENPYKTGNSLVSGAISSISDEDSKQSTKSHSESNEEDFNPKSFLDALQAYSYEYKDSHKGFKEAGEGRHLSVMAQDLEKAGPVGKSMVQDTPNGKVVDYGKGFGAILASQAHLNKRLSKIEKKKK